MILLFGDKATKSRNSKANNANKVKNQPVENAGILAMSLSDAKSLLTLSEYDTFISSNPVAIDYAMYANYNFTTDGDDSGFMGGFSAAIATLGDCGFSAGGFDCGGSSFSGASCSSFSSVG